MPASNVTTSRRATRTPPAAAPRSPGKTKVGILAERVAQSAPVTAADPAALRTMIAEAAYYRAERRGFAPGGELQDWLDAEAQIQARLDR